MAPRGRHRKKNTRMQAALKAMLAYGFSKDLVRKKLKELLNVYGEENWLFIEENSYKVLIDNILEHVEQEEQQKDDTLAGPSTGILAPASSETEALNIVLPASEDLESALQINAALDAALLTHKSDGDYQLLLPGEGTGQKGLNFEQNSGEHQDTRVFETSEKNYGGVENSGGVDPFGNINLSPLHVIPSEQRRDNIPIRKRKPCHGWISNDDELNKECLIRLKPTPLPAELVKLLFGTNVQSRRRTRWDLRPEDLM